MKGANVKVFDQVTAVAFPGSSGGGMFLKENGEYIGMLTQGVMKLQGFNFIVPVRRIHALAKDAKIEWAIDPDVPDADPEGDRGDSRGGCRPVARRLSARSPAGGPRKAAAALQAAIQLQRRHSVGRAVSSPAVGPPRPSLCRSSLPLVTDST